MWETILSTLVTALGTVLVAGVKSWLAQQQTIQMQQQLGALTYETIMQNEQLVQAKAAETSRQVISSLTDDALAARMRSTNINITAAYNNSQPAS